MRGTVRQTFISSLLISLRLDKVPRSETPETKMPNVHIRNPKNGYRINRGEDLSGPSPENKFKWPRGKIFTAGQSIIDS
jgi:hypothetical protein